MAHMTARSAYERLTGRLNRSPQGAPASELLFGILRILFTEKEAGLVAALPTRPFTAAIAARAWNVPLEEARRLLDGLAGKALLLDIESGGETRYVLPPPMAGFFEFSMMRVRDDVDQKALSELLYQYLNVEDEFITALFCVGETRLGRAFVQEAAVPEEFSLQVFDYERASWVIRSASAIGIGMCYCRHKMQHLGRACEAPMEICMTFNTAADSLIRHGFVRRAGVSECLDLLQLAQEKGLTQFGDNVRERVAFICNCCGCCCEAMIAARRFGFLHPVHTTNFIARLDPASCNGCGLCVRACPVSALSLVATEDASRPGRKLPRLDESTCLGCGVCVRACKRGGITLAPRKERVFTPVDTAHRFVLMAIERGTLQDLIVDNQTLASHRAMAAILGVILRLPPVKQAMASHQMRSRYLEELLTRARKSGSVRM